MTVGRNQYNEADLLRMQQDAEARVREMHNRTRQTVEETNAAGEFQPRNRNWSTSPNTQRGRGNNRQQQSGNRQGGSSHQGGNSQNRRQGQQTPPPPEPEPEIQEPEVAAVPEPSPTPPSPPKKKGTVVGDIMDALGLDEDYLLIIGLLLILINQRADTTLILALAYLLI